MISEKGISSILKAVRLEVNFDISHVLCDDKYVEIFYLITNLA